MSIGQIGDKNVSWKGGRKISSRGYVLILDREHPLVEENGYILEHRMIAAEKWGIEAVRGMVVHHKDGNKQNNAIENLELMSNGDHGRHHDKTRIHKTGYKMNLTAKQRGNRSARAKRVKFWEYSPGQKKNPTIYARKV